MMGVLAKAQRALVYLTQLSLSGRIVAAVLALLAVALFNDLIGLKLVGAHADFWRAPHNDMAAMQAGAEAVFRGAWRFPLTVTNRLLAPADISIVYTDSIPWMTLALKITGAWKALNGLGLFLLASYILQPLSMLVLLRACDVRQAALQGLGACLALLLPAWLMRHGHVALTGHWIIILALATSVASARTGLTWRKIVAFTALAVLAMGVHAYHLPPVGLCFAAAMASEIAQKRPDALRRSALAALLVLVSMALTAVLLGYGVGQGHDGGRGEIGFYSMNVLGPLLPQGSALFGQTFSGGWFTQVLDPNGGQWFEGYNYLGAGALLLIGAAVLLSVRHGWLPIEGAPWRRRYLPLTLAMVTLTLAAIGPTAYLANRLLFTGPKLSGPFEWLSLFRAHGRFFWSVAYLLIAVSVWQLGRLGRPATIAGVIVVALSLQVADTQQVWAGVRHTFAKPAPSFHPRDLEKASVLQGRPWVFAPIYFCAPVTIDRLEIGQLTLAAVRTGGTSNGASSARGQGTDCRPPADAFLPAGPKDPRITVVMEESAGPYFGRFVQRPDCRRFLRGLICGRGVDKVAGLEAIQPFVAGGAAALNIVYFDKGIKPPELATGWAGADPTGVWSDGLVSTMVLDTLGARAGVPLVVELHAMSFAAPPATIQRIGVSVGGRLLTTWTVEIQSWRPYRVSIPADLVEPGKPVTLTFSIPNANPSTPQDRRRIGLGVQKVLISQ